MQRRTIIAIGFLAAILPTIPYAQSNPLQSAFEDLADSGKRAAQEQLQAGGFYEGSIDGRYGRGTHSALVNAAQFIHENSYRKVYFDLSNSAGAQRYVNALARGELGKYLFGEGDEADY